MCAVDKTKSIIEEGGHVIIPTVGTLDIGSLLGPGADIVERVFPHRSSRNDPIDDIRDEAELPEPLKLLLPVKWEQFQRLR